MESTLLKLETPLGPEKVPDLAVSPDLAVLADLAAGPDVAVS